MPLLQVTFAGYSILHLLLMATAVIVALGLATALGFFIARRYYKTDATQRVTLYQRELVRQKRRTTDGGSQSTLLRRERDRARRHVQRTVRLRQAAQARAEGRADRKAYAPVNILRPMPLKQQQISGSVYQAEGALNIVRESARSLVNSMTGKSKKRHDEFDDLTDELAQSEAVDPVRSVAQEPPAALRRGVHADAPAAVRSPLAPPAARVAGAMGRSSAAGLSELKTAPARTRFVPEYEQPPATDVAETVGYEDDRTEMMATAGADATYGAPETSAPAQSPPRIEPVRAQAPGGNPAPAARASSSDLKRRLAQVRERSAAQRAQMAEPPARKTS